MAKLKLDLFPKQYEAWKHLTDHKTKLVGYWGAAWWWKTFLWCSWLNAMCIAYPWSRWFMARDELKRLKQSTLMTMLWDVYPLNGMKPKEHYEYRQQDSQIVYYNWSLIFLLDASRMPSDPMYQRFWSIEVCGWFIDEAAEVRKLAVQILLSRCRYKLDHFGIIAKLFGTFNPDKNRVYDTFYKPRRNWKLPKDTAFIQALATDNPYAPKDYIQTLDKLPEVQRQRLKFWNFEYDDRPNKLYEYNDLLDMRTNPITNWDKFISCDVAREWKDRAVIMVWDWREIIEVVVYERCKLDVLQNRIIQLAQRHKVNMSRVVVDADGMGAWVVDNIKCVPFHNNAKAIQTKEEKQKWIVPNFQNLKTQCYIKFQEYLRQTRVNDESIKEELAEELDVVEEINLDKDNQKRRITAKEDVKERLWRSPDLADCLIMRCYFELLGKRWDYRKLLKAIRWN